MAFDPYKVLGVSKTANDEEIRKAYKKLVRANHPDVDASPEFHHLERIVSVSGSGKSQHDGRADRKGDGLQSVLFHMTFLLNML